MQQIIQFYKYKARGYEGLRISDVTIALKANRFKAINPLNYNSLLDQQNENMRIVASEDGENFALYSYDFVNGQLTNIKRTSDYYASILVVPNGIWDIDSNGRYVTYSTRDEQIASIKSYFYIVKPQSQNGVQMIDKDGNVVIPTAQKISNPKDGICVVNKDNNTYYLYDCIKRRIALDLTPYGSRLDFDADDKIRVNSPNKWAFKRAICIERKGNKFNVIKGNMNFEHLAYIPEYDVYQYEIETIQRSSTKRREKHTVSGLLDNKLQSILETNGNMTIYDYRTHKAKRYVDIVLLEYVHYKGSNKASLVDTYNVYDMKKRQVIKASDIKLPANISFESASCSSAEGHYADMECNMLSDTRNRFQQDDAHYLIANLDTKKLVYNEQTLLFSYVHLINYSDLYPNYTILEGEIGNLYVSKERVCASFIYVLDGDVMKFVTFGYYKSPTNDSVMNTISYSKSEFNVDKFGFIKKKNA